MLMEAVLDLFSMGLPVHLHDSVVSRYILVFLELVDLVTRDDLCFHTLALKESAHQRLFPLPILYAVFHPRVRESR